MHRRLSTTQAWERVDPGFVAWLAGAAAAALSVWTITARDAMLALAAVAAVALVITAIRWPLIAGVALVASVPVQQVGAVGPLTATRALALFAVGLTALFVLTQTKSITFPSLSAPFALLIGWMVVSASMARNTALAVDDILRWTIAFVAFLIVVQLLFASSRQAIVVAVAALSLVGASQAMLGIGQSVLGVGPESFAVAGDLFRGFGTFGRPNTYAGYLEMALFPALWVGLQQALAGRSALTRYRAERTRGLTASAGSRRDLLVASTLAAVMLGSASLIALGIVLSFSRGAWLGVALGAAVTGVVAFRRASLLMLAAVPIAALVLLQGAHLLAPAALTERIGSIVSETRPFDARNVPITDDNFAAVERMAHWQAGWDMFLDHPVAGVGPGNYNDRYPDYFVRQEFRFSQGHAHNFYIHVLAETGLVGLVLYVSLIGLALGLAFSAALARDSLASAIGLAALGTTVAVAAHNVFENLHVLNLSIQLSATWALVVAARALQSSATQPKLAQPGGTT